MITQQQKKFKVLLLGDVCDDVYQYGVIERISPEAPVPIFKKIEEVVLPGMAENVEKNLLNLGCQVTFIKSDVRSKKTRLIDKRSKQHIVRIDEDNTSVPLEIPDDLSSYDSIVVSDYNKGSVEYHTIMALRKKYNGPIFVDTKKDHLSFLEGCFIKINELEKNNLKSICKDIIITHGENGAEYNGKHYPAPCIEVVDVTGAGDTFLASLAYQYMNTQNMDKSIEFAILASSITVQKFGVYAPTYEEISCSV